MEHNFQAHPTDAQSVLDLGNFKARSTLYALCQFQSRFRGVVTDIVLLGKPILSVCTCAMGGVFGLQGRLCGWFVSSDIYMNARIHGLQVELCTVLYCTVLHCNKMFSVIHFTCQCCFPLHSVVVKIGEHTK